MVSTLDSSGGGFTIRQQEGVYDDAPPPPRVRLTVRLRLSTAFAVAILSSVSCSDQSPSSPLLLDGNPALETGPPTDSDHTVLQAEAQAIADAAFTKALELRAYVRFFEVTRESLMDDPGFRPDPAWIQERSQEIRTMIDEGEGVARRAEDARLRKASNPKEGIPIAADCPESSMALMEMQGRLTAVMQEIGGPEIMMYESCEEGPCWWDAIMLTFSGIGFAAAVGFVVACFVADQTKLSCGLVVLAMIAVFGELMDRAQHYILHCTTIVQDISDYLSPKCAEFLDIIGSLPESLWEEDGSAVAVVNAAVNWCSEMGGGGS